jgi:hypothetical protein
LPEREGLYEAVADGPPDERTPPALVCAGIELKGIEVVPDGRVRCSGHG